MNVLIVETETSLRRALEFALAMRGHLPVSVDDALTALDAAMNRHFPLIILGRVADGPDSDSQPAMLQLCRDLRRLPGYAHSSILAASPPEQPDLIIAALDAGANGYLRRPIDANQLRDRIEDAERLAGLPASGPIVEVSVPISATDAQFVGLASDLALVLDELGRVKRVVHENPDVLGGHSDTLSQVSIYALCHPEDTALAMAFLADAFDRPPGSPASQIELRFMHHDGTWRAMDISVANRRDDPGIGGLALVARDMTERRMAEQRVRREVLYDALTGLPNRSLFFTYLENALARADRRSEPVVVMFMDIDDFAAINAACGRDVGDQVLSAIGDRLDAALRATDTAARMNDDEFTILLEGVDHRDEAHVVAERIAAALRVPHDVGGQSIVATVSIGVAFSHPASRLPNVPTDQRLGEVLRQADAALYRAKSSGKDRWVFYDAMTTNRPPSSLPSSSDVTRSR